MSTIKLVDYGPDVFLEVDGVQHPITDYQLCELLLQGVQHLKHQATWRQFQPPIRETT